MQAKEAYRAGFMLKCASLGMPSEFAEVLYACPGAVVKKSIIGSLVGHGVNLAQDLKGAIGDTIGAAGDLGTSLGKGTVPGISSKSLPADLSDDTIRNILLAAHYRRARQALADRAVV
jgi:hypothetical protein